MIDLRGIWSDEGFRMGMLNGGRDYAEHGPEDEATWPMVMKAVQPYSYQPGYFLLQNAVMRITRSHDVIILRLVNVFFLWVSLQGLIALTGSWRLLSRLFLLGLFSFNTYLLMHVLQVREYIVALAFYVWTTWFVVSLDRRTLGRTAADVGWFAAYGVLLVLGFYTQSWTVFPAIGQALFLLLRRRENWRRFLAGLSVSYLIVLAATLPYLLGNLQKVNSGRWGKTTTSLWGHLSTGFHLVATGHLPLETVFTEFLAVFWLALVVVACWLLFRRGGRAAPAGLDLRRHGWLAVLCMIVPLGFQIGHFLWVDDQSVWARYFIVHYFFVMWLVALAFRYLQEREADDAAPAWGRGAVLAAFVVMLGSASFQVHSYYRNPHLDTGETPESNWRLAANSLARVLNADDVVLTPDFIHKYSLTYSRPMANRVIAIPEIDQGTVGDRRRVVYLEYEIFGFARRDLIARLAGLQFDLVADQELPPSGDQPRVRRWRVLIFQKK